MKDALMDILSTTKVAISQAGGTIKEGLTHAANDMKVGTIVAAGTTAGGAWTGQNLITWTGFVLSVCLIVRYVVDIKKSLVEVDIMKQKELDRQSNICTRGSAIQGDEDALF